MTDLIKIVFQLYCFSLNCLIFVIVVMGVSGLVVGTIRGLCRKFKQNEQG